MKRKLTKREYLGDGYVHHFSNDKTGKVVHVPCTKEEYEKLGGKDGSSFNPTLKGHTWLYSSGGTIKVDTPDTTLGEDEFCIKNGEVVAKLKEDNKIQFMVLSSVDVNQNIDESKIQIK